MTDFQILHIEPTKDLSVIKAAFRKLAKEIHPDINDSTFTNHVKFILLQQAYHRLLKADDKPVLAKSSETKPFAPKPVPATGTSRVNFGLIPTRDPAYSFYKAGIREYTKVHPSVWSHKGKSILLAVDKEDLDHLKETENKVRQLIKAFPKAYYYFSIVVNDFPDSMWVLDAQEKLKKIELQTIRYRSIIESFISHAKSAPRVNRMF